MEVRVIFMDATAEKVFKNVDNIYTKGGLLVIREGDWLYKYPLEHIFSIVHKHGAHWGSNAWKKKEFTKKKVVHDLTITVDKETLKNWDNPTGFMDGWYKPVWGEFDNYLTVRVKPSTTLEGDDFVEVCLYKDGKEVASTYPDFLFDPIRLEYNGEEYHIQLEKECKKSESELRYTEDYF